MTPGGAPFGGFCPATSISLRRRPLSGTFQAGPAFTGGRPHTLDNPVLPPCHATQALPARCQGRQGFGPSKARKDLAPTSPGGDHFPRTRSVGSCVSPPNPAPAPPRHNALWCIRGRNATSLGSVCGGGEECVASGLFLLGDWSRTSPAGRVRGRMLRGPRFARAPQHEGCTAAPLMPICSWYPLTEAHNGSPHPEVGAHATLEGRGQMGWAWGPVRSIATKRLCLDPGPQAAVKEVFIDS